MAAQLYTTYAEALRRAQAISNGLGLVKKPMHGVESSEKRKWQGHNKKKYKDQNKRGRTESGPTRNFPTCPKCNKRHFGECLQEKGVCYNYGKTGHFLRVSRKEEGRLST
ncbi:Uncharacterized protein Adt_45753 [Abeliophyllum distichum]|uniref:Uncharacterized protein n=1 Tax=Abeliophyllum distichum TaxID=126358 RepID=A0ABD1PEJ8_9LAMI